MPLPWPAALLEQEQWQAVQVAPQFQQLAAQLEERGAQAGAPPPAPSAAEEAASGQAAAAAEGSGAGSRRVTAGAEAAGGAGDGGGGGGGDGTGEVPRKFTITPPDGGAPPAQQQPAANGGGGAQAGPAPVLVAGGRGYHVVNTQLLMLSMLCEYLAFRDAVPSFAAEVAQRVLELLKVFNSRTCQLVLGAGAMQVGERASTGGSRVAGCRGWVGGWGKRQAGA